MKKHNEKLYVALALAGIVAGLSACSHNTAGITVGTRFNAGLDPQNATANLSYVDGLNVIDVSRENSVWKLEIDGDSGISYDEQSGSLKGVKKIERSIGPQITGYLVELSDRNPEAALEYVNAMKAFWEAESIKAEKAEMTATESEETATEEADAPAAEEMNQVASAPETPEAAAAAETEQDE